jgi:hypothetical protein
MRTASQILARHCPVPHPVREGRDEEGDYQYYVPMKDTLAAVREARGQVAPQRDISPMTALGLIALTLVTSLFIFVFAGACAVIDNVETAIARVRLTQAQ